MKGKKPLRPRRGPDGRWIPPPPDPEPPDDQGVGQDAHAAASVSETPVTAGGLVIRDVSPRRRLLGPPVNTTTSEALVRSVRDDGRETAPPRRSPSVIADAAEPLEKGFKRQPVTMEEVTDEDGGPPRRIPSSSSPIHRESNRASPESEQRDSVIGNPVAESTAQGALHEETQFHSLRSHSPSVGTSRFSRNTQSIQRVLREHAERAEARAQSAYEQSRSALDLISKSMDNVRGAFTEARRARDRFHDMLSVSARSRQSVRRSIEANSLSAHRAEKETAGDLRKVADYQRRVRSQVLGPDERRELQPSPVSSWRLRSGMYPASQSRLL